MCIKETYIVENINKVKHGLRLPHKLVEYLLD